MMSHAEVVRIRIRNFKHVLLVMKCDVNASFTLGMRVSVQLEHFAAAVLTFVALPLLSIGSQG